MRGHGIQRREGLPFARLTHVPQEFVRDGSLRQPRMLTVRRCAERLRDLGDHVEVVLAREDGLPPEDLAQDAADRPEVQGRAVLLG